MRRGPSPKKNASPDPVYNSILVSQLTNQILKDGKKDKARTIVYDSLSLVQKQDGGDPLIVLKKAFWKAPAWFLPSSWGPVFYRSWVVAPVSPLRGAAETAGGKNAGAGPAGSKRNPSKGPIREKTRTAAPTPTPIGAKMKTGEKNKD